jgi:hypothetical protein
VLHLASGWWVGFVLLVVVLGLHLNPPRGDNWAGIVGLFVGLLVFCRRHRLGEVAMAAVITGLLGASGFCLGQMIKMAFIATGAQWGWHAVMEWIHGLFFGIALTTGIGPLVRHGPALESWLPKWTGIFASMFVLWIIPHLNFRRSPPLWLRYVKSLPQYPYGLAVMNWLDAIFAVLGVTLLALMILHLRRPLAVVPESWLGKGQLLYLVLLWSVTLMSFSHVVVELTPIVLAIQWGITINAIVCTFMLLRMPSPLPVVKPVPGPVYVGWGRLAVVLGLLAIIGSSLGGWVVKRALFGDAFAGYFYINHIRFGPNNTNDKR